MSPAIRTEALTHRYGERLALDHLDLTIDREEMFCFLGPNGGGKSTLFRILTTLIVPSGGRAEVCGFDTAARPGEVRRRIGVVFQSPSLDRKLTVRENLTHAGHLYGLRGKPLADTIGSLLDAFQLAGRSQDLVESLSGGLQRRVEIAKCLLPDPEVILMDEPSTGLDPAARIELWSLVARLRSERRMTVVYTSHLMEEAEKAGRLCILANGRLVALGSPDALRSEIGGNVIRIRSGDAGRLDGLIRQAFAIRTRIADGQLRLEHPDAYTLAAEIGRRFPELILEVSVAKPTLEDVFVAKTGVGFGDSLSQA